MKKGMSINSLMKHMRTNHGMEDLRGSDRKILLRNMGYFHGYKGFRFVRKPKMRSPSLRSMHSWIYTGSIPPSRLQSTGDNVHRNGG